MDILGVFVNSSVRLEYMSVAVGTFYFGLMGIAELIDLDGWIDSAIERKRADNEREREWRAIAAGGEIPVGDLPALPDGPRGANSRDELAGPTLELSARQEEAFELGSRSSRSRTLLARESNTPDEQLLRFGKPRRHRIRDRRLSFAGALACALVVPVFLLVALHPQSFKKKYARESRSRQFTNATEKSDRDAFKLMAGFAFVIGSAFV